MDKSRDLLPCLIEGVRIIDYLIKSHSCQQLIISAENTSIGKKSWI